MSYTTQPPSPQNYSYQLRFLTLLHLLEVFQLFDVYACKLQSITRRYNLVSILLPHITAPFNNTGTLLNERLRVPLPAIMLTDLSGNRSLLQGATSVVCDWLISIQFV